jgi:membrane associated rhomboid family serine protease
MFRISPVVKNLILINIAVFIGMIAAPKLDFGYCHFPGTLDYISGYLSMWNVRTDCFKPYQLFTYMFVHSGLGHIFFNMLMLAFFGPILEEYLGQGKFLLLYMICGIGAGAFNMGMDLFFGLGSFGLMAGASGAVYGVMTAFGIFFPNMELRLLFLPFSFRAKYMVMFMGAMAIYFGFQANAGDNVAHLAHLGGIVVAIILIQIWRSRGSR